ncbi:hypothetical protein H8E88_19335 [candidate division KSB1 bacterium]|nr:hypothetical protein [candidate division KSB1 bacterium]
MDFESDTKALSISEDALTELASLASKQIRIANRIANIEAELKIERAKLYILEQTDIPNAMDAIGMSKFVLTTGEFISCEKKTKAVIAAKNRIPAFEWLRANGAGSLIKNVITAKFGKDEGDKADKLYKDLESEGYNCDKKESVHGNTLTAHVNALLKDGKTLSTEAMELLGVFEYYKTKVEV